jgi:cysteinyl-tRNA synthetase
MHTGLLNAGSAKMSKSAHNVLTIREALGRASFRTLRYAFTSQHYRSSMVLNDDTLRSARSARRRVENFASSVEDTEDDTALRRVADARDAFFEHMDDDFDTPGALAALFGYIREQNRAGHGAGPSARRFLTEVDSLFDSFRLGAVAPSDAAVEKALEERESLRRQRRYEEADRIRASLTAQGVVLEDTPTGTKWRHGPR